jgi:hypothetical protein
MSNTAFSTIASNPILAQPVVDGPIYIRSDNAADATTLAIYGTISAAPGSQTLTLAGKVEVNSTSSFSALTQAILGVGEAGTVSGYAAGTAAVGDITGLTNPSDGATLTIGLTGFTRAYRFKNTLAAAYDVKIGATVQDTMSNFSKAINASGTPGTEYYAGTLINSYLSATVSTSVVTLTDRIPCNRQLAWTFTESASNFAKRVPSDGADGIQLFTFSPSVLTAANKLTFSTEDTVATTLPALMRGVSSAVSINGGTSMFRYYTDHAITVRFQSSTDNQNWHTTSEGDITLSTSAWTTVVFAQIHDFLRMVIVTNSNTTDTIFDARVVY